MAKKTDGKALASDKSAEKDVVVAEWQATKREFLRVVKRHFKGSELIDLRRWYRDAEGQLCPGKGISFRPGDIKRLRKALRKADRLLHGRP